MINLESESYQIRFDKYTFSLRGFEKNKSGIYEVICTNNVKRSFDLLKSWINLDDLRFDIDGARLKAGRCLHRFSSLIRDVSYLNLVDSNGVMIEEKSCGRLISIDSFKIDNDGRGLFYDMGNWKIFEGLNVTQSGIKVLKDKHGNIRFCDFVSPFFK